MSQPKGFGRDVQGRRVVPFRAAPPRLAPPRLAPPRHAPCGPVSRDEFLAFWSGLMLRRCGSARQVAYTFRRTEQTGRNWIDGVACPTGLDVARAYALWPAEFDGALLDLRLRAA